MQIRITNAHELGMIMRASRKTQNVRLDDLAGSAQVGAVFVGEAERGKESVHLGKVMRLLHELGIVLQVDVPESVLPTLEKIRQKGVKPVRPRKPSTKLAR